MADARWFDPHEPAGEADFRRLLEEALGPGAAAKPGEPLLLPPRCRAWLAGPPGAAAGFARTAPDRETRARGRLCLDALFVSPPRRREGIGKTLLRAVKEAAREEGLGGVWGYFPEELPEAFLAATGGRKLRTLRLFRRGDLESVPYPRLPPGYVVRPLVPPADLEPAAGLYSAIFSKMWNFRPHAGRDIAAWFEEEDASPENCLLLDSLAEPSGLIGMAMLAVDPLRLRAGDRTAYVPDIGVRPEYRGKGWGEVLIGAAAHRARELKLSALELIADDADIPVTAFYRRMGFEERGALQVYEWEA